MIEDKTVFMSLLSALILIKISSFNYQVSLTVTPNLFQISPGLSINITGLSD